MPPTLTVEGSCPGPVAYLSEGITSFGQFVLLGSDAEGNAVIPSGPCAGLETGLASIDVRTIGVARGSGKNLRPVIAAPALCGTFVQALEPATCELSNVASIP